MAAAQEKQQDFETLMTDLKAVVDQMNQGDLSLEDSLKAFEKGVKLSQDCKQILHKAELKVSQLVKSQDELALKPFDLDADQQG
jgi:exodeoxyribonuclease VII small subunit